MLWRLLNNKELMKKGDETLDTINHWVTIWEHDIGHPAERYAVVRRRMAQTAPTLHCKSCGTLDMNDIKCPHCKGHNIQIK